MNNILNSILDYADILDEKILWGVWTTLFITFVYILFTVKSGFFQIRKIGYILRNTFGKVFEKTDTEDTSRLTPFQATSTALASTVGMGSIAGVATALSVGGPGAIFWMWLFALIGMMAKTAEITLAVHYRDIDENGSIHGGPMYYIRKGLGWNSLAKIFSFSMFINAVFVASLLQAHTVGRSFLKSYSFNPYIVTGLMGLVTAIVVIGGVARIGKVCERLVPFMSIVYIIGGLILFIYNFTSIPEVFNMIFYYAFNPAPAVGGFAGALVMTTLQTGVARGMLANEAGLGTAPMIHSTADTSHPFKQGLWGAFEVCVVTFIICTITAFAVLSTGVMSSGESGIELVIIAFSQVFPESAANLLISFSILTFCLSTQIGFFIYYETSVYSVFGKKSMKYLKWFYFIPAIIFANVADVDKLWVFANIAVAVCAIPNLIAVLSLNNVFFKLMKDYLSGENRYATSLIDNTKEYIKQPKNKLE